MSSSALCGGAGRPAARGRACDGSARRAPEAPCRPDRKLEDLKPSPIAGIYEFTQGADVSYITADGKYFLDGSVYDMATRANLTEVLRSRARIALISAVPESEMVIFSPKNPLYTITVFTDVDCQYCRKLHSDMQELNRLGVRVRYMFYPAYADPTPRAGARPKWCGAQPTATTR